MWGDENAIDPTTASSVLAARELDDAFVEGMELLRNYRVSKAGGIEAIVQLACDLATRRLTETQASSQASATTIGARLRSSMWGFGSHPSIKEIHEDYTETEDESSDEDEPLQKAAVAKPDTNGKDAQNRPSISSRLANTVWKGITNQSAMEAPPSPTFPSSPVSPNLPLKATSPLASPPINADDDGYVSPPPARASKFWGYAEKLRDSDTAAAFAKVSTNWRVKAMDAWSNRASVATSLTPAMRSAPLVPPKPSRPESLQVASTSGRTLDSRRSSMPEPDRSDVYSPPARPAFFKPVRDSYLPEPRKTSPTASVGSDIVSPISDAGSDSGVPRGRRTMSVAHLGQQTTSPQSATSATGKSGGVRPLLLNSSHLITQPHSRSPTQPTNSPPEKQWAENVRASRPIPQHRHSQSSMSSLAPEVMSTPRRAETSIVPSVDTSVSRIVPLNRKTPSPMARARRTGSVSSTPSSPPTSHSRLPTDSSEASTRPTNSVRRNSGWAQADSVDSSLPSPPLPRTPQSSTNNETVRVHPTEAQRGSMVLADPADLTDVPTEATHTPRKPSLSRLQIDDTSDSSVPAPAFTPIRTPRVRSKRFPPRLNSVRVKESRAPSIPPVPTLPDTKIPSPNSLAPPEWSGEEVGSVTPRAATFDSATASGPNGRRSRKLSGERSGDEAPFRPRKLSGDGRARKVSSERTRKVSGEGMQTKHKRESAAVEGDDEGYDELLSAYESEA